MQQPDGGERRLLGNVEAGRAAFVALHPGTIQNGFTANITVTGELRGEEVALTDVGDEAVQRLRAAGARDVKLGRRNEIGSAENPGLTQAVTQGSVDLFRADRTRNSATGGVAAHLYVTTGVDTAYVATVTAHSGSNTTSSVATSGIVAGM